jgi:hypothetical protein
MGDGATRQPGGLSPLSAIAPRALIPSSLFPVHPSPQLNYFKRQQRKFLHPARKDAKVPPCQAIFPPAQLSFAGFHRGPASSRVATFED